MRKTLQAAFGPKAWGRLPYARLRAEGRKR